MHPTLAIPELMRILIDDEDLPWNMAWSIVTRFYRGTYLLLKNMKPAERKTVNRRVVSLQEKPHLHVHFC